MESLINSVGHFSLVILYFYSDQEQLWRTIIFLADETYDVINGS